MKSLLTNLFFIYSLFSFGQDLTGLWKGDIYQGTKHFDTEVTFWKIDSSNYRCYMKINVKTHAQSCANNWRSGPGAWPATRACYGAGKPLKYMSTLEGILPGSILLVRDTERSVKTAAGFPRGGTHKNSEIFVVCAAQKLLKFLRNFRGYFRGYFLGYFRGWWILWDQVFKLQWWTYW